MHASVKIFSRTLAGLVITLAASNAIAYNIDQDHEQGFLILDVTSTAPVRVEQGLTPQQAVDQWCPGGKVTEINLARTKGFNSSLVC